MSNYIGPNEWNLGGSILQVAHRHDWIPTEVQISRGSYYNYPTLSITPKSTNSTLLFMSNPRFYTRSQDRDSSYQYGNTHIYVQDITNTLEAKTDEWINYCDNQYSSANTDGFRVRYPVITSWSNTSTSTRQFRTRAYVPNGYAYGRIGGEGAINQIILEIQA